MLRLLDGATQLKAATVTDDLLRLWRDAGGAKSSYGEDRFLGNWSSQ
jgi:hypothetical protein